MIKVIHMWKKNILTMSDLDEQDPIIPYLHQTIVMTR